ncbi:MAG: IS110 family transposase [Methyloligellaceae bacterium]
MNDVSAIGIDLAKRIFEVCALDVSGNVIWSKRLKREAFKNFMRKHASPVLIGLEACGSGHYWARFLGELGYQIKMMSPRAVKAYLSGPHKNDARDARAIAEAATRPHVRSVAIRSEEAQAIQALQKVRDRCVRQKNQTLSQLRSLLYEYGIISSRKHTTLMKLIKSIEEHSEFITLPELAKDIIRDLHNELKQQMEQVKRLKEKLAASVDLDERCVRLQTVPYIGPVNAALLSVKLEDPASFKNGRAFASYLGLTPRQQASGEKNRLMGISKHGDKELRRTLVEAANSMLYNASKLKEDVADSLMNWARKLLARKDWKVAAVAVANKIARIAWAVIAMGKVYSPSHSSAV